MITGSRKYLVRSKAFFKAMKYSLERDDMITDGG